MLVTIKTTTCHVCHAGTLAAPFYMKDLGPRDVGHVVGMTHAGKSTTLGQSRTHVGHATGDNNFAAPSHMRFLDTW